MARSANRWPAGVRRPLGDGDSPHLATDRPDEQGAVGATRVLISDDPVAADLMARGWRVVARSWAARLHVAVADCPRLDNLRRTVPGVTIRELAGPDVADVLRLDAATGDDYPGGVATALVAAAVADLARSGTTELRTGGASENQASIATFTRLGAVIDQHWLTLQAPIPVRRRPASHHAGALRVRRLGGGSFDERGNP